MTTQKKKLLAIIGSAVALALVLALVIVLAVQCSKEDPNNPDVPPSQAEHPETGVYYFDAGIDEYTLTLNADGSFALIVKGNSYPGLYTLTDGNLTLDFTAEGKETVTATLADNVVSLTYDGAAYRMLKKVNYTVTFEANGGSAIEAQTVLNGKTVAKPADPTREGFLFVGWYADSAFKTPFAFGAQPIFDNVTVYARWSAATANEVEYTVDFDLNYENATALEAKPTVGGKLFDLPVPTREGYTFKGWWISMDDDGSKLSYQFKDEMVFDAHTTLYALWEAPVSGSKLAAPVVNVEAGSISWNAVNGARSYAVKVVGPNGATVIDETVAGTTLNVPFATYAEGAYQITVVANANSGDADNSEAVRYYTNKALGKVSVFQVIDSMLVFNTVEHAEKYLVTVVCGNPDHQHTNFDNGASRTFNFANCAMTKGGIRFTVTAVAEGYASSVSKEFVYSRELSAVSGLRYDAATQTVVWNEVADAASYMVSVTCGNSAHTHTFLNNGSQTAICLKECAALDGGIVVKVYPKTNGYNSPDAVELKVTKTTPATPSDVRLNGTTLTWTAVAGATKYEVQVGDQKREVTEATFDMASLMNWVEGTEYTVSVRAIGNGESLWSDAITARYNVMGNTLRYAKSVLSWDPVIGASAYELCVNDGAIVTVADGASSAKITLTRAGKNVIRVRSVDGNSRSEWVELEVFAHAVTFDTRGGSEIGVQYKAVGDLIDLPVTEKVGYGFNAWYNVPGGPACNGMAYTDELFAESGALVLYAHYNPNKYTVNYHYGTDGTGDKTTDEVAFENNYQLTVPTPNEVTSVFGGWYSAPYGMGTQYTDGKGASITPWTATEGADIYAFWIDSALQFTLTKVNGKDAYAVSAGERIALLSEVTVPATYKGLPIAMLSGNAFKDCTNLKVINLPDTLEQISNIDPFNGCSNLEAVNVYGTTKSSNSRYWSQDGVLFDNGTGTVAQPKLLFMPLAKTGSYRIPAGITEIPAEAFANCSLSKITVPTSVTKIGREAFANSTKLTSVLFETATGEPALTISARAFSGCTMLEKIVLPARMTDIVLTKYTVSGAEVLVDDVDNAFVGCTSLSSVTVVTGNKNFKSVDGVLYSADGKTLVYCPASKSGVLAIPVGTQTVAPGAFIGCNGLTEITVPNTVTLIGECAFYGLSEKLTTLTFAGNAFNDMIIDKYAFRGCEKLATITFEAGSRVTTIGEGAFMGCKDIVSFEIPASVSLIKASAFADCTGLKTLTFAASSKTLEFGENVFNNCEKLTTVTLPANVSKIPGIFNGCTSLEQVNVAPNSEYLTSEDGVVFNKAKTEILFFPQGKSGEYAIPATVTKIANGVFRNVKLDKLTIYNTIAEIGEYVFHGAVIGELEFVDHETLPNATELTLRDHAFHSVILGVKSYYSYTYTPLILPAHTKTMGAYAFASAQFEYITLNEGLTCIGDYAFKQCSSLYSNVLTVPTTVKTIGAHAFDGTNLKTVVLNEGLESIGDYAFYNIYYLYEIEIPASVRSIGNYAFAYSTLDDGFTFGENSVLETIGAHAFEATSLVEITIPKTVTSVGAYAFASCYDLEAVTFEEGGDKPLVLGTEYSYTDVDYTGISYTAVERGYTFYYCNSLETVALPSRLTEIAEYCFNKAGYYSYYSGGSKMDVTFGENSQLQYIGAYAFADSELSGEFVIPKSVQNLAPVTDSRVPYNRLGIGERAFYGTNLTKVTFEAGGTAPLTIGYQAFGYCTKLTEITFPARLASYTAMDGSVIDGLQGGASVFIGNTRYDLCTSLENIFVEDATNTAYVDIDGVLYKTNGTAVAELVACPVAKEGTVTVPNTVTVIHNRAFYGCEGLEAIEFVAGGTADITVGAQAFYRCLGLTTLTLPENVVSLGSEAFYGCSSLETLTLSAKLTNFNGAMVDGCSSLSAVNVGTNGVGTSYSSAEGVLYNADKTQLILYPCKRQATEFTVPATVKMIGANAFYGNKALETVVLPAGLLEIKENAFNGCSLTAVTIPNTVTLIGKNAFRNCYSLEEVIFEKNGTAALVIQDDAFNYDYSLEAIELPARLSALGSYVFSNAGLTAVEFEENSTLVSIGDSTFANTDLVEVTLPEGIVTIGEQVFFNCTSLEKVTFSEGLVSLGNSTFAKCTALTEVHFPASLKTMGINTFYYYEYDPIPCSNLTIVTFASGSQLTAIPSGTFACTGLTSFEIPANVKEIGDRDVTLKEDEYPGAFAGCSALEMISFELGTQCAKIGAYAFNECSALKFVTLPTSVSTLGEAAFRNCTSIESITIPETCTNFALYNFYGCSALKSVQFNSNTTALAPYMFAYCSELSDFEIPEGVSSIGDACFAGTALTEITVPASVTNMSGYSIFSNCHSLESVTILGNVTEIGKTMFEDCENLVEVNLPASVEKIGEDAFANCAALTEITLPAALKTLEPAFAGSGLAAYKVAEGNTTFAAVDGVLFSADLTSIISYPANKTSATFTIPKEVTNIAPSTFAGITTLRQVLFEEGGTHELVIGDGAFNECSGLQVIELPERLTSIGYRAFYDCYNLITVVLPSTLEEIGDSAFGYCYKLIEVGNLSEIEMSLEDYYYSPGDVLYYGAENYYTATEGESYITVNDDEFVLYDDGDGVRVIGYLGNETELVLPANVTVIGNYAFISSGITSVTLHEGITEIGKYAFADCIGLTEITLPESLEKIGEDAFNSCSGISFVLIPENVTSIGYSAFYYMADDLVIVTPIESKPYGWSSSAWSSSTLVIYGYSGAENTYTFVTNCDQTVADVITALTVAMPELAPIDGMYFCGWYDNAEFSGSAISGNYYSATKTTLYAKWLTQEQYEMEVLAGTSFEYAINLAPGSTYNVIIDEGGERVYFAFTATEAGSYTFYGNGSGDTYGHMYSDANGSDETKNDDDGPGSHFQFWFDLEAGETVYFAVRYYSSGIEGSFEVVFEVQ